MTGKPPPIKPFVEDGRDDGRLVADGELEAPMEVKQ